MATLKRVSYATQALFVTADLNSLANGSATFGSGAGVSSNVYDNTGTGAGPYYIECDVQILLGSITPGAGGYIGFGFLWSEDGTNYPDPQTLGAVTLPAGTQIFTGGLFAGASAKSVSIPGVPLRPLKGKPFILNQSGVALAGSGNSCLIAPAGYTMV